MKRFLLIALLLAAPVHAQQNASILVLAGGQVDNQFIFGKGSKTRTQRVINAANPAVIGLGQKSSTLVADASVTNRFVTVENYGSGTDVDGRFALVSGITVDGNDFVNQSTLPSVGFDTDLIDLDGQYPRIDGCIVWRCRGIAVDAGHGTRISNSTLAFAFTGASLGNSDCMMSGNFVYGCRDECLLIEAASGNNSTDNNHFFGSGNYAARNNGGAGWHSTNDKFADAAYGIHNGGHRCEFVAAKVQHCYKRGILENSNSNSYDGCMVDVQLKVDEAGAGGTIGVEFVGDRNSFNGGVIELTNYYEGMPATAPPAHQNPTVATAGVQCSGHMCTFDTRLVDNDFSNGTIGHKIPSAVNGQTVHYETYGFHQSNDRILVMTGAAATNSNSLDIKIRIDDVGGPGDTKALADYFDIGGGWTGSIEIEDCATGLVTTLTEGQAF